MKRMPLRPDKCRLIVTFLTLLSVSVPAVRVFALAMPDHIHVVNSIGDESDSSLADGVCMTINNECTLRAAIEQANDMANLTTTGGIIIDIPDEIWFAIAGSGVHTIQPQTQLPDIVDAVLIDGYTQAGASPNTLQVGNDAVLLIELDGSLAGANADGLFLNVSGSIVRGLVINNFAQDGIQIFGFGESKIEGNFIGTDPSGSIARRIFLNGVAIRNSASNHIGGAQPAQRNLISGNDTGVFIGNGPSQLNHVEGNYIGTNASGTSAVPNDWGVLISAEVGVNVYASRNRIGGVNPGEGNLISGNSVYGLDIFRGTQNEILGNLIGTTIDGESPLPNAQSGVLLFEGSNNVVGGLLDTSGSGVITAYKRNVISGNGFAGVELFVGDRTASGNQIVGNFIGTNITGMQPIPNNVGGVFVSTRPGGLGSLTNNIIGGTDGAHATRNIISGNLSSGVLLVGDRVSNNSVVGNFIGLDVSGMAKLGNELDGVRCTRLNGHPTGPSGNFIGTSAGNGGNVISGNGRDGVAFGFASSGNFILNNYIGLDVLGTGSDPDGVPGTGDELGNARNGVVIFDSPNNFVGLGTSATRNVISGNVGSGVFIGVGPSGGGATGNRIAGNYIGVDVDGGSNIDPILVGVGNLGDGITIEGVPGNIVGGAQVEDSNVISRNVGDGVHITGTNAIGNALFRNLIGVAADGFTELGNQKNGIFIASGSNNTIGDVTADLGNVIAHNNLNGVVVASSTGNLIRGNQIFGNGGLGIDLGNDGFTENDTDDVDTGANNLQNFPTVVSKIENGTTTLTLNLDVVPNSFYVFDVYSDNMLRDIFAVQGRKYLSTFAITSANTNHVTLIAEIGGEHYNISVTVTDAVGNTSEFGREQLVHSVEFTQAIQIFQPLDELQTMLADTGEPPVPMIAGKPGVMRVYLKNLNDNANVDYQIDGLSVGLASSGFVAARLGCTPKDRRRGDRSCSSIDLYFTDPPQGQWDTTLTVLTPSGDIYERHRFRQVTRTAIPLVLNPAEICHTKDASGAWICGHRERLEPLIGVLRSIVPTHSVTVRNTSIQVKRDLALEGQSVWQNNAVNELASHYNLKAASLADQGIELNFLIGLTTSNINTGGIVVNSDLGGRGRAAWVQETATRMGVETNTEVVAHETCHLLGRRHTNLTVTTSPSPPGCYSNSNDAGTDWPYCDNTIQSGSGVAACLGNPTPEVGFDVAGRRPLLPEATFSIMSYCTPRWISPLDYLAIANSILAPKTTAQPARTIARVPPINGAFWLVTGTVENGTATMGPLMQFDTMGFDSLGEGSHRIEIRDAGEVVLSTRLFEPMIPATETSGADFSGPPYFSELLPVVPVASSIVILDDLGVEVGRITLGGVVPTVTVNYAPGVNPQAGPQTIGWTIVDPDSAEHTVWVQYSNDNGLTWQNVTSYIPELQLQLNFDDLPGANGTALFRVLASDGVNTGVGDSAPFSVATKLPLVEIFFPADGTVFRRGQLVWLQASASDGDDGSLDDAAVVWTSSLSGGIGQGRELQLNSLSVGTHTITVTATDSDGNMATHSIDIVVEDSLIVEMPFVINVPTDQPTIQAGIDSASSGDEVLVAPGTYNEIIDFHGKAITVRSSGGAAVTTIDATSVADPGSGKPVVRCDNGERYTTVLDGFTITGGTGAIDIAGGSSGGGMFINGSSPTVTNCVFSGNTANRGGGMYNNLSSPSVTNSLFSGNTGSINGGGMFNTSQSSPVLTSCTFSLNTADTGGGMFNISSSSPAMRNCIFWMNSDLGGIDESAQIHNDDSNGVNLPTVTYSDVQGGWTGLGGTGNINIDPLWMDPDGADNTVGTADDDLRLQASSPCIDSGDAAFAAGPNETDLDGHTRVLCSRVDMGAYEFAGDFACDQTIDLTDFANWDACMTGPGGGPYTAGCETFDCDADLDIDMRDFAEFSTLFSP